jgi:crotonobetainyl-CoA:carnitine CoA-transferase CaiB-like acyl-CoA transferase
MNQQFQKSKALLSPYRVLDLTDEKGLLCGKILADLGANVIKVEKPGGDPARSIGPYYHDIPDPEKSLFWFAFNTNKKSITLNIETVEGRAIFKKLIAKMDIIIESFEPNYLDKLGLSYVDLSKINSRLIMTSITAFGQTGPYADLKASDIVVFAMGGLMSQCGDLDRPPVRVSFPQSFMQAGADAAEGTMVALYYCQLTGEGQHVDVSAQEGVVFSTLENIIEWDIAKFSARRPGHEFLRPSGLHSPIIWECRDGYVSMLVFGGQPGAKTNRRLTEWLDTEGIAPDYLKNKDWENWDWERIKQEELDSVIDPIAKLFKLHTKAEIQAEAVKRGIQIYPVFDSEEILKDPQMIERGFWVNVEHDDLGIIVYPGAFAQFSETPIKNWQRAPHIGEHNEEIYLRELGLSAQELNTLKGKGVI